MAIPSSYVLVPGSVTMVPFLTERDFAGVMSLRAWRWESTLGYPGGPGVTTHILPSRAPGYGRREVGLWKAGRDAPSSFAEGGRAMSQGGQVPLEAGKGEKQTLPWSLRGTSPTLTWSDI